MNPASEHLSKRFYGVSIRALVRGLGPLFLLCAMVCASSSPLFAQSTGVEGPIAAPNAAPNAAPAAAPNAVPNAAPDIQQTQVSASAPAPGLGTIAGVVVDESGSIVVGAQVRLTRQDHSPSQETVTGDDGQFSFENIAPGAFQIAVGAASLSTQAISGTVHAGEVYVTPQIVLPVATQVQQITVSAGFAPVELAEFQIQDEEKQRVLGIIPNFYVSYVPHALPLTWKQKFELAWRSSTDPATFVGVGALAGIEQAADEFNGYGQGAQGYGKRYGASYGDVVIGTFLGSAVLPSVLKQDPRYFYKGTGSKKSRILYALASPLIAKGDNGKWQPNYSYVAGNLAAGGIANLYYPAGDRNGVGLLFETTFIRFGENALSAVLQEFVFRKLTPHLPN